MERGLVVTRPLVPKCLASIATHAVEAQVVNLRQWRKLQQIKVLRDEDQLLTRLGSDDSVTKGVAGEVVEGGLGAGAGVVEEDTVEAGVDSGLSWCS